MFAESDVTTSGVCEAVVVDTTIIGGVVCVVASEVERP